MPQRLLTVTLTLAVAATLALSGCAASSPAPQADESDAAAEQPEAKTPLSPYWDAMYGVYDDRSEIEKREKVEKQIAECMAAEGFDYTPIDQSPETSTSAYEEGWGTESWVVAHGYGAFPTEEETRQIDEQVAAEDPNQQYIAALSQKEQAAYYEAFDGPALTRGSVEAMKGGEAPVFDPDKAGCRGAAEHAVNGDDPTQSERYAPLVAAMNALSQDQLTDPAMAPIDAEWSACMAGEGYDGLATKQAAADAVFAQASEYWDSGATDEPSEATRAEWRAYELDVALTDFHCAETVDYEAKALEVQVARENRFIDDNRSELDAMLAEIAQGD